MKDQTQKLAELEALLFIHGEPISTGKIAKTLGIPESDAQALLTEYSARLASEERGFMLVSQGDKVQLATKPAFGKLLETFVKGELGEELSPASVEALAIVAYFGPVSRVQIDFHRGVNSSFIVRSLLIRGLIDRSPDPARPNSYLYTPSFEFLKHVGISKPADLPEYSRFRSLFEKANAAGTAAGETGQRQ